MDLDWNDPDSIRDFLTELCEKACDNLPRLRPAEGHLDNRMVHLKMYHRVFHTLAELVTDNEMIYSAYLQAVVRSQN